MEDRLDHSGQPGDLSEKETLARLTVDEKRRVALDAIIEFPHLDNSMVVEWLDSHDCDYRLSNYDPSEALGAEPAPGQERLIQRVQALIDCLEEQVDSSGDPEALDRFIYGYLYPANLRAHDIDPDEVAEREPLDVWEGVYDL